MSAFGHLAWQRTSDVVMRYLLEKGCPVDHVSSADLCLFHDLEMVRKVGAIRIIKVPNRSVQPLPVARRFEHPRGDVNDLGWH